MTAQKQIDAIRFQQGIGTEEGQIMYLCALPARWLAARASADRWRPEVADTDWENQGYQREPSPSHIQSIVRYLRGTFANHESSRALPVFPTSVLLAARSGMNFQASPDVPEGGPHWVVPGRLTIPTDQRFFIIDGQHRIEGLEKAMAEADPETRTLLGEYYLPVTIMECKDKIHELIHFVTINKEAKSVTTALAEELLNVVRDKDPSLIRDERIRVGVGRRAMPLAIVRELVKQKDQPWFGRIARPNERRKGDKVASQGQLSKSLRHICGGKPVGWDLPKVTQYVVDFWKVIAELLPEPFAKPREYTLQRGVGFGALHQILLNLVAFYDETPESIRKVLAGVDPYFTDPKYWVRSGESSQYSSEGGYRIHAEKIIEAIQQQQTDL